MHECEFKDYEAVSRKMASILYSRSQRAGNTFLTKDDFYSEVCLTFMRCKENFDPSFGATFKTYFINAINMNYGMIIRKNFDLARATGLSLDQPAKHASDEDSSLHDSLSELSDDDNAEVQLSMREAVYDAVSQFPLSNKLLEIILDPPEEFLDELRAYEAQRAYAKELDINMSAAPKELSYPALSQIFGFNWRERRIIRRQLEEISGSLD